MINALADASFIYSVFDKKDADNERCVQVLGLPAQQIYFPTVVVGEVAFLVRRNQGAFRVSTTLRALRKSALIWINAEDVDYDRAADIMDQYRDARLDLADCVITAMAERMNIQRILTLDRRDFGMIKPKHCPAFEILP